MVRMSARCLLGSGLSQALHGRTSCMRLFLSATIMFISGKASIPNLHCLKNGDDPYAHSLILLASFLPLLPHILLFRLLRFSFSSSSFLFSTSPIYQPSSAQK